MPPELFAPNWLDLLHAARAGDGDALNRLFTAIRPLLSGQARTLVPKSLQAKFDPSDVVQHTLEEAFTAFGTFAGMTLDEFFAWLLQVLRRNALDAIGRYRTVMRDTAVERPLKEAGEVAAGRSPDDSAESHEEADKRARALANLAEGDRVIIEMRHTQGWPYAEIAAARGITEEAARKQFNRAAARWVRAIGQGGQP